MKKLNVLTRMLLLVALLVGSVSVWGANVNVISENMSTNNTIGKLQDAGWVFSTNGCSIQSGMLQIASSNYAGTATTPTFSSLVGTTATLTFSHTVSGGTTNRTLTITGVNCKVNGNASTTVSAGTSTGNATISITEASTASKITFSAAKNAGVRIDNIVVYYTAAQNLNSFAFEDASQNVTLIKYAASDYRAENTQTVTIDPLAYDGTVTYSISKVIGDNTTATINSSTGVVSINATANEASQFTITATGTATSKYNKPTDATYTLNVAAASTALGNVVITPDDGEYYYGQEITIFAENAEHIYYTLDDSNPTTSSNEYTSSLSLTDDITLKVLATQGAAEKTGEATFLLKAPEAPTFDVPSGAVAENTPLTITAGEGGSTVVYTIDGTDPTASSDVYSSSIAIDNALTIKARTMDAGNNLSDITSATYTLTLPVGTKKYVLMTNTNQLADKGKILIVNSDEDYTMSTTADANNRPAVGVEIDTEKHEIAEDNLPNTAQVIELEANTDDDDKDDAPWYFKVGTDAYLYAAASGSNHLKTSTKATAGDNGKAAISISSGTTSVVFAVSSNRNVVQFNPNNNSPIFSCYGTASQTAVKVYVQETEPATINANVSAAGWATYATKYPMTFEDGDAYVIVSADNGKGTTTMSKVTSVPENTAVLLKGTAGEATVKTATIISGDAPSAPATNYLHIVKAGETINASSNVYVLAYKSEGIGFYPWTGTALARGKVYMQLPAGAKLGDFYAFGEETGSETNGINAISTRSMKQGEFYNLAGQRVSNPTKGLYIVNGKKVIIK